MNAVRFSCYWSCNLLPQFGPYIPKCFVYNFPRRLTRLYITCWMTFIGVSWLLLASLLAPLPLEKSTEFANDFDWAFLHSGEFNDSLHKNDCCPIYKAGNQLVIAIAGLKHPINRYLFVFWELTVKVKPFVKSAKVKSNHLPKETKSWIQVSIRNRYSVDLTEPKKSSRVTFIQRLEKAHIYSLDTQWYGGTITVNNMDDSAPIERISYR